MICKNCGTELYGEFCSKCGAKNIPEPEEKDNNKQEERNAVMAYIDKHFEDNGCQSSEHFVATANFIPFLYRFSALIAIIVFVYAFIQNFSDGFLYAVFQSALGATIITYIVAVIINGTFYEHKYYNLCSIEYIGKGKPLNEESICKFMAGNIFLSEYTDWSYGYDQKLKCGFVEYVFKGAEKHVIFLYPDKDRYEVQIGENYTKTHMMGTFSFKQAKYYNNLTIAKTVIILAMNYYLERI